MICCGRLRPPWNRDTEFTQTFTHAEFVLSELESMRSWLDRVATSDQLCQNVGRDVFVVEGDDVAALGECKDSVDVGVVANLGCCDLCRGTFVLSQHSDI